MVAFRSQQHYPEDQQLEHRVLAGLRAVDPVRFRNVSVSSRRGVVVLIGTVTTPDAKSFGFHTALSLPGVESVIDALQVDRPQLDRVLTRAYGV